MDMNHLNLEDLRKVQEDELRRNLNFKEKYHLYNQNERKKICLDLKLIKICI